jgi:hypothetical protein
LPKASATPVRSSMSRCLERSRVIAAVAWPSIRCTASTLAPAEIARLAVVCLRPSCATRGGSTPPVVVKTRPLAR